MASPHVSLSAEARSNWPEDGFEEWDDLRLRALVDQLGRAIVDQAAERLSGKIVRTPALRIPSLEANLDCEIWLKAENLQHVAAFKARGALNFLLCDHNGTSDVRPLITYSSGNHGQAVAWVGAQLKRPVTVVMPTDAPTLKVERVRALGAQIVHCGTRSDERRARCHELATALGAKIIPPFDHPDIIAGQGTATLEFLEQVRSAGDRRSALATPPLDALFVPVGGGGLIAGACLVAAAEGTAIYGVEPEGCDALSQSLAQGVRVSVDPVPTIADGLKPTRVGALNFAIARRFVREVVVIDEASIQSAMARLALEAKLVVEGSGAIALAAALRLAPQLARSSDHRKPRIGVLLSGGNVAASTLIAALKASDPA